jgi:hypothetical protein
VILGSSFGKLPLTPGFELGAPTMAIKELAGHEDISNHSALHALDPGNEERSDSAIGKGRAVWRRGGDGSRGDQ